MKEILKYLSLGLILITLMSIYDPAGSFYIQFNISNLDVSNRIDIDTGYSKHLEIAWNTGDTGHSIIITEPGTYVCSVKDVWPIYDELGSIKYNLKPVFIKGYPDVAQIDTFIMDTVFEGANYQSFITLTLTDEGTLYDSTFRDTLWTTETQTFYTETRPGYSGFFSGMLDTIYIQKVEGPIILNANILSVNDSCLKFERWDVSY